MTPRRRPPISSLTPFRAWLDRVLSSSGRAQVAQTPDPARAAGLEMVRRMLEGDRRP